MTEPKEKPVNSKRKPEDEQFFSAATAPPIWHFRAWWKYLWQPRSRIIYRAGQKGKNDRRDPP